MRMQHLIGRRETPRQAAASNGAAAWRLRLGAITLGVAAVFLIAWLHPALGLRLDDIDAFTPAIEGPAFSPVAFSCNPETCREVGPQAEAQSGIFVNSEIDLTGDGTSETIRLSEGKITISEKGREVWRSPATWTVVDLALGDPNDDGRYEILAAFWRADDRGTQRSQPFIIGYRQGGYRTLWGGSPIAEPIVEVALGDVDGDGAEDLVVLEAQTDADPAAAEAVTVAVWRWHGWGFSRMWRSDEGLCRDLVVVPGEDGTPGVIQVMRAPSSN
ncbi:MAG: hypothetical protein ACP5HG_12335 [Anaerolineae bacterium]